MELRFICIFCPMIVTIMISGSFILWQELHIAVMRLAGRTGPIPAGGIEPPSFPPEGNALSIMLCRPRTLRSIGNLSVFHLLCKGMRHMNMRKAHQRRASAKMAENILRYLE